MLQLPRYNDTFEVLQASSTKLLLNNSSLSRVHEILKKEIAAPFKICQDSEHRLFQSVVYKFTHLNIKKQILKKEMGRVRSGDLAGHNYERKQHPVESITLLFFLLDVLFFQLLSTFFAFGNSGFLSFLVWKHPSIW